MIEIQLLLSHTNSKSIEGGLVVKKDLKSLLHVPLIICVRIDITHHVVEMQKVLFTFKFCYYVRNLPASVKLLSLYKDPPGTSTSNLKCKRMILFRLPC